MSSRSPMSKGHQEPHPFSSIAPSSSFWWHPERLPSVLSLAARGCIWTWTLLQSLTGESGLRVRGQVQTPCGSQGGNWGSWRLYFPICRTGTVSFTVELVLCFLCYS